MGKSQETYKKKEVRTKKEKKRKEKEMKRVARRESATETEDNMIAYVDEFGRLTSEPPDPTKKKTIIKAENIQIKTSRREESEDDNNKERKGVLTFFNDSKGYGYIKDSETRDTIFVHISEFKDDISLNSHVSYIVGMGNRGPIATQVKLVPKK